MNFQKLGCYLLLVGCLLTPLFSLPPPTPLHAQGVPNVPDDLDAQLSLRFHHLTSENELPDNHVESILQDRRGFIWFATWGGLARYDGYHTRVYANDVNRPNSLSSNFLMVLAEDRAGMLWVGTREAGLNRFDPDTERVTRFAHNPNDANSLSSNDISALAVDQNGQLWVGTLQGMLNLFDPQTEKFARYPLGACGNSSNRIRKIIPSSADTLWLAAGALRQFNPQTRQTTCYQPDQAPAPATLPPVSANPPPPNRPPDPPPAPPAANSELLLSLNDIQVDATSSLWLASATGFYKFEPRTARFTAFPPPSASPAAVHVTALQIDQTGLLWLGTLRAGLQVFEPRTEQFIAQYQSNPANPDSLSNEPTIALQQSRDGVLWRGTPLADIDYWDRWQTQFKFYRRDPTTRNSFLAPQLHAITQAATGTLWMGSTQFLTRFDRTQGTFQHYDTYANRPPPLGAPEGAFIIKVIPDREGYLWFDGLDGLGRFDPRTATFQYFRPADQPPNLPFTVWTIAMDRAQNFWLLTNDAGEGTLYFFDRATQRVCGHGTDTSVSGDPARAAPTCHPRCHSGTGAYGQHGTLARPVRTTAPALRPVRALCAGTTPTG